MRKIFLCLIFVFCSSLVITAQSIQCPAGVVCITPEAARKMLENDDKVKALEAEGQAKDQAITDQKKLIADQQTTIANQQGQISGLEKAAVRSDAIIDLLLKSTKKKCLPLSVCIN